MGSRIGSAGLAFLALALGARAERGWVTVKTLQSSMGPSKAPVADDGAPLRCVGISWNTDPTRPLENIKSHGLNGLLLWYWSAALADDCSNYDDAFAQYVDPIVDKCAAAGIYVVVEYNTAHQPDHYSLARNLEFWKRTAARYGNRSHVVFSLDAGFTDHGDHAKWFAVARAGAPKTHLVVFGPPDTAIDYSNASCSVGDPEMDKYRATTAVFNTHMGYDGSDIIAMEKRKVAWDCHPYYNFIHDPSPNEQSFWDDFTKSLATAKQAGFGLDTPPTGLRARGAGDPRALAEIGGPAFRADGRLLERGARAMAAWAARLRAPDGSR